jgi:flagellar hook-associated protein 3 FlgL
MTTRIATYYQNQNTLRNLQLANAGMALSSYQVSTGLRAQRLSDFGGETNRVLTLRDVKDRTDVYMKNLTNATNTTKATESALQQMTDLLADAVSTATLGRNQNSASTRAALAPKAQSLAESFITLYKSQYNGQYLFSGSNGQNAPTNVSATATAFPGSPVPTTFYQGDSQLPGVMTGAGTTLSFGVLGNEPAFANMKAGLEALWYGLQNNNVTEIDNAISSINQAKGGLTTMQGLVGGQLNTLELVKDRHQTQQQLLTSQLDELEKVDVSEALTQFSQQQATIQASSALISRINQLSLLNFLR